MIFDAVHKRVKLRIVDLDAAAADDALLHIRSEALLKRPPGNAHDREVFGQQPRLLQVIERRQKLPLGKVARGSEDHDDAGVGRTFRLLSDSSG